MIRSRSINRVASMALALLLAAAALVFSLACAPKDPDKTGKDLTDEQLESIMQIAEAFFEFGIEVDSESALPVSQLEAFVNYLYNDELTADETGFGTVPAEESDARLYSYFGFKPVLRTRKNNSDQDFYYNNENYYVRVKQNAASEIKLVSAEKNEDGLVEASVELRSDEAGAVLHLVFEQVDNDLRVVECTRMDEK